MALSRCGRRYATLAEAVTAAEARTFKSERLHMATSCAFGDHWHVIDKGAAAGTGRPDPFPPAVAAQLDQRDPVCQRCGYDGRLERHHRRAKHMGGSKGRAHTQCACNGVRLCRHCHEWVHLNPRAARAQGWIVTQGVSWPGRIGVELPAHHRGDGHVSAETAYPTCDGWWKDEPQ